MSETGDQKRIEEVFQLLFKLSEVCFSLLAVNSSPDCWTGRQTHRAGRSSEATQIWLVTQTSHNTTQHHRALWKLTRSCHTLSDFNVCVFSLEATMATGHTEYKMTRIQKLFVSVTLWHYMSGCKCVSCCE